MHRENITVNFGLLLSLALLVALGVQPASQSQEKGQSAAALIKKSLDKAGPEAARKEFMRLLKDKDRYAFAEDEFISLGNDYLRAKKPVLAAGIFEMAAEIFPGSVSALRRLAHSYYVSGDEERSLKTAAKMISVRGKAELAGYLEKNRDSLASTAEGVIKRCLKATGGRRAWEAIKTMVLVFSIQSTAGNQPRMERMYKRPHLFRQGMQGATDFTASDGRTIWRVSGGKWTEMPAAFHRFGSIDSWLLDYHGVGISYEFVGFDHINGSPVYHLKRTYRDGFTEDLYFSAVSNLLTEIRSDYVQGQPFMKSFMSLWNYRDVNGVKIPFVFMRNMGPLEPPHGGVVEEVRINVPLDDSLFLPPDDKE